MKVIGITGKSGSGKTTFASLLAKRLNCKHIDIDKIGHESLHRPELLDVLCERFGNQILDKNGNVDRKKIGEIVFAQRYKMEELSDITWGFMQQQLNYILSQDEDIIILDWILLPNSKYWELCEQKILVKSNDIVRKNRVIARDNISEEYFNKRDSASIDYSDIQFDCIFENDYQEQTMNRMINRLSKRFVE